MLVAPATSVRSGWEMFFLTMDHNRKERNWCASDGIEKPSNLVILCDPQNLALWGSGNSQVAQVSSYLTLKRGDGSK